MEKTFTASHTIRECEEETRLSEYLLGIFSELPTRKSVKKALKNGLFRVNGKTTRSGDFVKIGDEIILKLVRKPVFEHELDIIFEDDYLAIIDKPAGLVVSGNTFRTVENALPFNLKVSKNDDALLQPLPAHRLDFPTRGILLIAKTKDALINLKDAFASKQIHKTYHALTIGEMPQKGLIKEPIDEKPSESSFEVVNIKKSGKYGQLNLVQVKPVTGRKHQIRKHLLHINHPILGDQEYGEEEHLQMHKGLYLHATEIMFKHPISSKEMHFKLDLPKKFLKVMK